MADAVDEAVRRALAELGIDDSFVWAVRDLLGKREEMWPECCGSGCDPCVLRAQLAARRAKQILGGS